jgi:transcriptional regulator with XRE-family HTH domain
MFDTFVKIKNMMIKEKKQSVKFGTYIHSLRKDKKYSLKIVADKLGIDISLLSKIENGERQLQSHMINGLSELFELDYKEMQIQLLNQKIENEYGNEPFFHEAIVLLKNKGIIKKN